MNYHLDKYSGTPVYKQLIERVEEAVRKGALKPGHIVPSMNALAAREGISRETVKKAYAILTRDGWLVPRQGKGFYIADRSGGKPRVLVIFDKLSVYKQLIFSAFTEELKDRADITVLTHNQSTALLAYYLDTYLDEFDWYVVAPHFPLDEATQKEAVRLLSRIPNRKLIMLDRWMEEYPGNYGAVYQDFRYDIATGLRQGLDRLTPGTKLKVVTLPLSLYGPVIREGIDRFASETGICTEYINGTPEQIDKGDVFLVLNSQLDWGLAALARKIDEQRLTIGKDVFIICYNDFELNEVVLGGLTTVSTDFAQMGRLAADMILGGSLEKVHCDFRMNRRSTF